MKKIQFTLLAMLFLVSTTSVKAITGGPEKKTASAQSSLPAVFVNQIYSTVGYPDFARTQNIEGFVLISFHFDENGTFVLNEINSSNTLLSDYVLGKMKELRLCSYAKDPKNEFNFRFDFSLE